MVLAQSHLSDGVASALIAAVVAFGVAVLGQLAMAARERTSRRYERRRAALLDVQDACLEFRQQLREYGELVRAHRGQPSASINRAEQHFDSARSRLAVMLSRVEDGEDASVAATVLTWRDAASVSFISVRDVPASQEQACWDAMNHAIGQALQHISGAKND